MKPSVTLQTLREYAASRPSTETFDLSDGTECLAAKAAGQYMWNHYWFLDGSVVPKEWAEYSQHRPVVRTAETLVRHLDLLIAGVHPHQVAES